MRTLSSSSLVIALAAACATTLFVSVASADESAPQVDAVPPPSGPTGRGVAIGLDNGVWGNAYEQGLRLRLPILEHFAINLRGASAFANRGDDTSFYVGGRVEMVGHTPVFLNLVRIYGGGGPEVMSRVSGGGTGDKTGIGGGGQAGFEFFLSRGFSFFAEIGGHSGDTVTAGGTALAGMMLYPFNGP